VALREYWQRFRAMNTEVTAVVVAATEQSDGATRALAEVAETFVGVEAALSRFRPESELAQLNRRAAAATDPVTIRVSPLLFTVVAEALAAARDTDGWFDPTVLSALLAAGYDRSFEQIEPSAAGAPLGGEPAREPAARPPDGLRTSPAPAGTWRLVRLDPHLRTITLPPGTGLDLGGIGKGWTVDLAARSLERFSGYAVDAGGDMYLGGRSAEGRPWTVGVEDPARPGQQLTILDLTDRAVATSTIARRRWRAGGAWQHHLIDPHTGRPTDSGVVSATVVGATAARSEVLAKVALLRGAEDGRQFLAAQPDVAGLLVSADHRLIATRNFVGRIAAPAGRALAAAAPPASPSEVSHGA
jgi:thiamine biosynthesis lipoprotein